ncbi:uncharacterized protein [Anoplolepis gracilipes]|uniref:uncharacterized protein isoform X1 n=1 Tax=Anoplolepis gracilipes TaxID=354296 RepID=UPI003B9F6E02
MSKKIYRYIREYKLKDNLKEDEKKKPPENNVSDEADVEKKSNKRKYVSSEKDEKKNPPENNVLGENEADVERKSNKRKYVSSEKDEKKNPPENNVLEKPWWIKHCTIENDKAHCRYCKDTRESFIHRVSIGVTNLKKHLIKEHDKINIKENTSYKILQHYESEGNVIKCLECEYSCKVQLNSSLPYHLEEIHKNEIENKQDDEQSQEINGDVEANIKNIISNFTKYEFQQVEARKKQIIEETIKEAEENVIKNHWWIKHYTIVNNMAECKYCKDEEKKGLYFCQTKCRKHFERNHSVTYKQENVSKSIFQYFKLQNDILLQCTKCNKLILIRINYDFSKHLKQTHKSEIESKQDEINQGVDSETDKISLISSYKDLIKRMFQNMKNRIDKKGNVIRNAWWIEHCTIENDKEIVKAQCKQCGKKHTLSFALSRQYTHLRTHFDINRETSIKTIIWKYFKLVNNVQLKCTKCANDSTILQVEFINNFEYHLIKEHQITKNRQDDKINQGINDNAELESRVFTLIKNLYVYHKKKSNIIESKEDEQDDEPMQA